MSQADASPPTREKLLDTAEELFARHGFAGVGMRQVADRVGIGKSSLFHHFPSKVHLYRAVLERVLIRIDGSLANRLRGEGDGPLAQLDDWIDDLIDLLSENPSFAPLLLRSLFENDVVPDAGLDEADRILERIVARASGLLARGIELGELRPVSVPHTIQSLIGLSVYHFASGSFGDQLLGRPIFSAAEIDRRKCEIRNLMHAGLTAAPNPGEPST